jgi:uncharacterized protein (TIGR02996 family)
MSDEAAFRAAVRAAPDDDAPRLRFADWLAERGDAASVARAEFIRVQCAAERLPADDPELPRLIAREQELLSAHQAQWEAGFHDPPLGLWERLTYQLAPENRWPRVDCWYVRGMVEEIALTGDQLHRGGELVLRNDPIRLVSIVDGMSHFGEWVEARPLAPYAPIFLYPWRHRFTAGHVRTLQERFRILEFRLPSHAQDWLRMLRGDSSTLQAVIDGFAALPNLGDRTPGSAIASVWGRFLNEVDSLRRRRPRLFGRRGYLRPEVERAHLALYFGDRLRRAGAWAVAADYLDARELRTIGGAVEAFMRRWRIMNPPRVVYALFKPDRIVEHEFSALMELPWYAGEAGGDRP